MSRQPAKSNSPYPGGPPGSVTYNKQPGAAVYNASSHARNFVPTTTWISRADPIEGISPGLEYLTAIDNLIVKQAYEVPDLGTSPLASRNLYSVQNVNGEQLYLAAERSQYWQRQCCGPQRGFTVNLVDITKKKVITLRRPFKCCALSTVACLAGISCFAQECTVECPPGNVIGTILQRPSCCCVEELHVRDETGKDVFTIQGPCECFLTPCSDQEYSINRIEGNEVGSIIKKWGGFCGEALPDGDSFSLSFKMDLDAKMKAILVGASFLVGLKSFEMSSNNW